MVRLGTHIAGMALALAAVACAESKSSRDGTAPGSPTWDDSGMERAPEDATWEADDLPNEGANDGGAEAGYGGLRPARPEVAAAGDADAYRAGDVVSIAFDLVNVGDADYHHHPGLILVSDHPDVEIPDASQWVEALSAGDMAHMEWWAVVGPTLDSGDALRFTATVTAYGCEESESGCPVAHSASITVPIE